MTSSVTGTSATAARPGEPNSVAQQDLVRTHLDQKRRQSAEVAEDRADQRVGGIRSGDVVRNPNAKALGGEDRVDGLLLGQRLARQRQVCIGRHQEGTGRQGRAGRSQGEQCGHRQPASCRLACERDLTRFDALTEKSLVGGLGIFDRRRIRVFGSRAGSRR